MKTKCQVILDDWQVEYLKKVQKACGTSFSEALRQVVNRTIMGGAMIISKEKAAREVVSFNARTVFENLKRRKR